MWAPATEHIALSKVKQLIVVTAMSFNWLLVFVVAACGTLVVTAVHTERLGILLDECNPAHATKEWTPGETVGGARTNGNGK